MSSGSLVALSTFLPAFFGFGLPALLPLAVIMLSNNGGVLVLIGYMVIAFITVSLGFSIVINRNVAESIRLRFENPDLLENLKLQKDRAEKASDDKSRFLAATSHDLRQPLHSMDMYLGALRNLLKEKEQIDLLDKGLQSRVVLNGLLTSLMDVSRIDAGEVNVDRSVIDIGQLLQSVHDEYLELASQSDLLMELKAPHLLIDSDEFLLGRIIRNIVNNACIHSGGNKLLLKAEKTEHQVVVSVCDNGVGISEKHQPMIFSEFYQLKNSERDRNKGLGLGLAIVKRLADLLNHDLQLESAPDKGACFKLVLPCVDTDVMDAELSFEQEAFDVSGLFIILVDDEEDIRKAMRSLLLQWGCELLVADNLHELLEELSAQDYPTPDIVLSDYRLRDKQTGLDVVSKIREYYNKKLPALIISGDTDSETEKQVALQGCELLHKPVLPDKLREKIYKRVHMR